MHVRSVTTVVDQPQVVDLEEGVAQQIDVLLVVKSGIEALRENEQATLRIDRHSQLGKALVEQLPIRGAR